MLRYWYDKAIARVLEAKNDFEVLDLEVQLREDPAMLKRQSWNCFFLDGRSNLFFEKKFHEDR